ncbi:MAG: hypothetical protein P1V51_16435 [Deltaproteobacteria bacterium]|nr:hypothetical protein [Deltaproteobacteria bacterium]
MKKLKLVTLLVAVATLGAIAGSAATAVAAKTSTRYLVFFEPGSSWNYGTGIRLQTGFAKHVVYFKKAFKAKQVTHVGSVKGKNLVLALGPKGATKADMKALAQGDPMVKAGVLKFEVRDWTLDFEGDDEGGFSEDELSDADIEAY